MLKNLWLDNFRVLRHLHLPDVGLINVIVGRNNSGKTALLEALLLASQPGAVGGMLQRINHARGFKPSSDPREIWETLFHAREVTRPVHMEFETDSDRPVLEFRAVMGNGSSEAITDDVIESRVVSACVGIDVVFNAAGKKAAWRVPSRSPKEGEPGATEPSPLGPVVYLPARGVPDAAGEARRFSRVVQENQEPRLLELLRLVEPDLQELRVLATRDEPALYAETADKGRLPLALAGDGMVRILSMLTSALSARGGLLLIDEAENGLHYKVQPKLWRSLAEAVREGVTQIFASTHSDECLRAIFTGVQKARLLRRLRIYRLAGADPRPSAVSYTAEDLNAAIESEQEIR